MDRNLKELIFKAGIFILSLSLAWWLVKSGYLQNLIDIILPLKFVSEITAGIFYTSFLTSPVSVAMLIVLARENNPVTTVLLAGFGAVLGDLLMLKFFRKELTSDLKLVSKELHLQRFNTLLRKLHLNFLAPFLGAIMVASPFPDELGLLMLGASRLKYHQLAILTYVLNTAGMLAIVVSIDLLS